MDQKTSILVATPCFGGLLNKEYVVGLLDLQTYCLKKDISLNFFMLGNESLITRARNICVAYFLDNSQFTHLLFMCFCPPIKFFIGYNTSTYFSSLF